MVQRRNTRQRTLVAEAVSALHTHPSANDVYAYVHERDPHVSLGTVYRNLNLLAEEGKILEVHTPGGSHYDFRTDDHDHVVCTCCGTVVDAGVSQHRSIDNDVEAQTGYRITAHFTVFEGICPACQEKMKAQAS